MRSLRARFKIIIAIALLVIATGFLFEWLLSIGLGTAFGHTQMGHAAGWIGLAVLITVFIYSIKKRLGGGWPKAWFWVHQIAGIAGPVIILIHSGRHFHALIPALAMSAMWLVVLSGVIGLFVHRKAIGMLQDSRKKLIAQGLSAETADSKLFDLAATEKTFRLWQSIHTPVVMVFVTLTIAHIAGALYFGGL